MTHTTTKKHPFDCEWETYCCEEGESTYSGPGIITEDGTEDGRLLARIIGTKKIQPKDRRQNVMTVLSKEDVEVANLISAAPDLLKALEAVLEDIFTNSERWGDGKAGPATVALEPSPLAISNEALNQARAAIAKARGN